MDSLSNTYPCTRVPKWGSLVPRHNFIPIPSPEDILSAVVIIPEDGLVTMKILLINKSDIIGDFSFEDDCRTKRIINNFIIKKKINRQSHI